MVRTTPITTTMATTTMTMTNNNNVILYKDFDPSLLNFEPVTKNKMGGKMVRITYGPSKQQVRIQTPELYLPFGVGTYTDEKTGEVSQSLDVAFRGYQDNEKVAKFYNVMQAFDHKVIDTCVERSVEWMGKTMSSEVIREFFRPMVKPPKDEKYSPLMKIKITTLNQSGQMPKIFDLNNQGQTRDLSYVLKGTVAKFIITIPTVWFVNKNFGVSSRLFQAAIVSRPIPNDNFAFTAEDPDEYACVSAKDGDYFDSGDM